MMATMINWQAFWPLPQPCAVQATPLEVSDWLCVGSTVDHGTVYALEKIQVAPHMSDRCTVSEAKLIVD